MVDRFGSSFTCDGCNTEMPAPVGARAMNWSYRLNELLAKGRDQGVLPHLLAIWRSVRERGPNTGLMGWHPGLEILGIDSNQSLREIDVFGIDQGRISIGECKVNGPTLHAEEIGHLASVGRELGAEQLLFATLTEFPSGHIPASVENLPTLSLQRADLVIEGADEADYLASTISALPPR